jgi:hypothetical protein
MCYAGWQDCADYQQEFFQPAVVAAVLQNRLSLS